MKPTILQALNTARRDRRAVVVVTDTSTGESRLIAEADMPSDPLADEIAARMKSGRSGMAADGRTFVAVHAPPVGLVVIGAVQISQALAPMAETAGFDITIVDPRTAFATPARFPDTPVVTQWPEDVLPTLPLDRFTALAALTHDPKIDDFALKAALDAGCFYVGVLGSRKTHAKRLDRLRALGLTESELARLHAPIGLDIGGQSPAEIAVAILAEIIAVLRRGAAPAS